METIKKMYEDGYFNKGVSKEQAEINYYKTKRWYKFKKLPKWLKEDIKRYEGEMK